MWFNTNQTVIKQDRATNDENLFYILVFGVSQINLNKSKTFNIYTSMLSLFYIECNLYVVKVIKHSTENGKLNIPFSFIFFCVVLIHDQDRKNNNFTCSYKYSLKSYVKSDKF